MKNVISLKRSLVSLSAVLALGAGAFTAHAQTEPARKTVELSDIKGGGTVVSVVGEVTAVDLANRVVTLKGPRGNISEMLVHDQVKNLDQVKVGDRVRLTYRVGVALALVKGGDGIREKVESQAAVRAAPGAEPGAAAVKTTTVVANVEAVNAKKKIVTLKGPEGKVVDVRVNDPQVMKDVKVGDQVAAKVTESVAVRVQHVAAQK